jgi:hypothetical protein
MSTEKCHEKESRDFGVQRAALGKLFYLITKGKQAETKRGIPNS